MVNANYDGQVFNICLADMLEKISDLMKASTLFQLPQAVRGQ